MPENIGEVDFRLTVNMRQTDEGAARFPGWQKFLSGFITSRPYNNECGADQLLSLQVYYEKLNNEDDSGVTEWPDAEFCGTTLQTRPAGREPYTFLAEITSTVGTRHTLSGTQSRLYEHLIGKGNQRILCDGLGGISSNPEIRLRHSQIGDFVLLTNNYDKPFYWQIGTGPHGCLMSSTDGIEELDTIGLTKALVTFQYRNLLFLCNTEEDGERKGNMIRWCGANPANWIESAGFSLAGHYELDYGEEILAAGAIGDFAYIHTTRGTWQVTVNPDPSIIFNFQKLPGDNSTQGCIAYAHTFVSTGDAHYYMGKDGIYKFNPAYPVQERPEWIHKASNLIYDNLNKAKCALHTAGFDPINQEMYFSCVQGNDSLPNITLYCNTRYEQCSKLDWGCTAFLSCTPSNSPSFNDWLVENCMCTRAGIAEADEELGLATSVKQGSGIENDPACTAFPTCLFTETMETISGIGADFQYEDLDVNEASVGAFCNFILAATINDLCLGCEGDTFFVFAHAEDYCLKQIGGAMSREMYNPTAGTYSRVGYESRMLRVMTFGNAHDPKTMTRAAFEFDVADELNPLSFTLRSGRSIRVQDPLSTRNACQIEWLTEEQRLIKCVPDDRTMQWPLYRRGEALYLDWRVNGIGGDFVLSSLEIDAMLDPKHI